MFAEGCAPCGFSCATNGMLAACDGKQAQLQREAGVGTARLLCRAVGKTPMTSSNCQLTVSLCAVVACSCAARRSGARDASAGSRDLRLRVPAVCNWRCPCARGALFLQPARHSSRAASLDADGGNNLNCRSSLSSAKLDRQAIWLMVFITGFGRCKRRQTHWRSHRRPVIRRQRIARPLSRWGCSMCHVTRASLSQGWVVG